MLITVHDKIEKILNSRVGKAIDGFFNSPVYCFVVAAVCILAHCAKQPIIGMFLLALMLGVSFVFCKNTFVIAPFALMCPFVLSDDTNPGTGYYNTPVRITLLVLILAFAVVAFSFNLIYYGKWKLVFKKAYFTVSLSLLSGALAVGGLFSEDFCLNGVLQAVAIAATVFLPYSMLINCGEYNGRNTVIYFANLAVAAAVTVGVFILWQYNIYDYNTNSVDVKSFLKLGAVGPNTGAAIILIAIPLTFYLVYAYKFGFLYYLLIVAEVFAMIMTYSRASLVVAIPGTIIVSIVMCFKKQSGRLGYLVTFGIVMTVVIALAVYYRDTVVKTILSLFDDGSDSGRIELWRIGFDEWKGNPVFGVGLWYLPRHGNWYYSFHCTPLTYLFCGGIVGLAAYIYHRYKSVRIVFTAKLTAERAFLALAALAMLLNALLDLGMTNPLHLMYYSVMLALIEKDVRIIKENSEKIGGGVADNSEV